MKSSLSGELTYLPLQRVVVAQLARLEADHPASRVGEREHQPQREVVVAALVREAGRADLVGGESLLPRLRDEPVARREPEPELLRDLLAEAALGEVRAHGRTRVRLPEEPLEVRGRLVEHAYSRSRRAARVLDLRRRLLVLERDAEPLREPLDRADEIEVLVSRTNVTTSPPLPQPKQ